MNEEEVKKRRREEERNRKEERMGGSEYRIREDRKREVEEGKKGEDG